MKLRLRMEHLGASLAGSAGLRRAQSAPGWYWVTVAVAILESVGLVSGIGIMKVSANWAMHGEVGLFISAAVVATHVLFLELSVLFNRPRRRRTLKGNLLARWPGAIAFMAAVAALSVSQSPTAASLFQGQESVVVKGLVSLWAWLSLVSILLCLAFPRRLLRGCRVIRDKRRP